MLALQDVRFMSMDDKQIKELSNNIMGCGCVMFLIPIFGLLLVGGVLFMLSAMGVLK